jgi:hypothetical protein
LVDHRAGLGRWVDRWVGVKPGSRDYLLQSKNLAKGKFKLKFLFYLDQGTKKLILNSAEKLGNIKI